MSKIPNKKLQAEIEAMGKEFKHQGEHWRRGYQTGYYEAMVACGGCNNCYGKGYSTSIEFLSGGKKITKLPVVRFCRCERGKQLKSLWNEKAQ